MHNETTNTRDHTVDRESRSEPRRRVLKGAMLTFNKGYGAFECVVRNQSEHGARLSFGDASAIPTQFDLKVSGEQAARHAVVQWRTMTAIGVRLI
jgi:hypothetical protein